MPSGICEWKPIKFPAAKDMRTRGIQIRITFVPRVLKRCSSKDRAVEHESHADC